MRAAPAVRRPFFALLAVASAALAASAPAVRAQAPARHVITHEDVFLMKRFGAPVISPDGRWAVFSVTEPSYEETATTSDLWLVPTDGSAEPAPEGGEPPHPDAGERRRARLPRAPQQLD